MPFPDKIPWFGSAPREQRYLAGISGGADSVALLHLLHDHGFRDVVVCHLDHGLRGEESEGDARFVQDLAGQLGYLCELKRIDAQALAASTGQSLETAARDARHAFFAECAGRHDSPRVLLGHHRDDQAETILWNLLRGSRGLTGMSGRQLLAAGGSTIELLRPLLDTSRAELRLWLQSQGLPWREDATNAGPFAVRNRIRGEVMPLLESIAKRDVAASLLRAADASRELVEIQSWAVGQAGVLDPQGRLHGPKLQSLPIPLQVACIYEFLKQAAVPDLSRAVVDRCLALLGDDATTHVIHLPGGFAFRRRQGRGFLEQSSCTDQAEQEEAES